MLGAAGTSVGGVSCLLQPETIARTANIATTDNSFFIRRAEWVIPPCFTRIISSLDPVSLLHLEMTFQQNASGYATRIRHQIAPLKSPTDHQSAKCRLTDRLKPRRATQLAALHNNRNHQRCKGNPTTPLPPPNKRDQQINQHRPQNIAKIFSQLRSNHPTQRTRCQSTNNRQRHQPSVGQTRAALVSSPKAG